MRINVIPFLLVIALAAGCATTPNPQSIAEQPTEDKADKAPAEPAGPTPTQTTLRSSQTSSPDHVQTEIRHDFNGDGVLDLALVTVPPSRGLDGNEAERILTLGIREGNAYRSVQSTECVALCPQCGGIMGDPYQGIDKVTTEASRFTTGGSRHRWSVSYTIACIKTPSMSFVSSGPARQPQAEYGAKRSPRPSTGGPTSRIQRLRQHTQKPVRVDTCGGTDPL